MRAPRVIPAFVALAMTMLSPPSTVDAAEPKRILMAVWNRETAYDEAFRARLTARGVDAEFTVLSGDRDRAAMAGMLRESRAALEAGKFDLVYTWGTVVTQMAKVVVDDAVPIVFNVVFDPVDAKIVDSLDAPGRRITGVTNGVPFETQFAAFSRLTPVTDLCLLFNAREPNANLIEGRMREWADAHAVPFTALRVAPGNTSLDEHLLAIRTGRVRCRVLYAGADAYLGNQAERIATELGNRVILLAGTARFVRFGWLAALAPGVTRMGEAAADLAADILAGGDTSKMPVVSPPPTLVVSKSAAARYGVDIPADAELED